MPEDKPSNGSGAPPGGGALRPTVMKAPAARQRGRKPEPVPTPVPVALPVPVPMPAASAPAPDPARPTTVRGTRRERVAATPRELSALAPEATAATCQAAARLLAGTVVETMTERKAVLWGHDLQQAYGDLMGATLALAQDPLAEQARAHVDRMTQILAAIDLMAVCGHGKGGLLAHVVRAMNDRLDTPADLAQALGELQLLLERLGAATQRLAGLADRLQRHAGAIARLEGDVDAAALAALYLARHAEAEAPELSRRFTDRAMSLSATVAQIRQGDSLHRLQLQQPLDLISVIQNVALVSLPGFLTGLAALLALAKSRGASPTEARDMSYRLRDLLTQLKT